MSHFSTRISSIPFLLSAAWLLTPRVSFSAEASPSKAEIRAYFLTHNVRYGLDIGNHLEAFRTIGKIRHSSGFGGGIEQTTLFGSSGGFLDWGLFGFYERELSPIVDISAQLSHAFYANDTASLFAPLATDLSLSLDIEFDPFSVTLYNNIYFGSSTADYFGVMFSATASVGSVVLIPSIDLTFGSQSVSATIVGKIKKNDEKNGTIVTATTITGFTGATLDVLVAYPIAKGVDVYTSPSITYTPVDALTTSRVIFSFMIGGSYHWTL